MPGLNKVYGGTPNHSGESRCLTCRKAHMYRGLADSSERVVCNNLPIEAQPFQPVRECTMYDDKRTPSRWDMEQIAWVLVTTKAGKSIGFISPDDRRSNADTPSPTGPNQPGKVGF